MIDKELLNIMICPACKAPVTQEGDWVVCSAGESCGKRYPIQDGIPVMLVDPPAPSEQVAEPEAPVLREARPGGIRGFLRRLFG